MFQLDPALIFLDAYPYFLELNKNEKASTFTKM